MTSSLEYCSWISIGLGLATALVIALDVRKHPQSMRIMNIVWPVTGLFKSGMQPEFRGIHAPIVHACADDRNL